jgi:two-component system chemotaxis sensor kinase CheA
LVRKAVGAGIVAADAAERLLPAQKTELIFSPGLSTAGAVTAISGRGVGMDVVRANVERIGGLIDVESRTGEGVRLTIRVPLTLTIIPALTVSAGGQVFAIPRSAIDEILRAGGAVRIDRIGEASMVTVRDRRMPLVSLADLLGVDDDEPVQKGSAAIALPGGKRSSNIILLKPAGGAVFALAVDTVHDHEERVVKPASPLIMAAGLYAGTTLADDGRPILLLDPSGLEKEAGIRFDKDAVERRADPADKIEAARETTLLMFRGLDGGLRAVAVALVERIEDIKAEAIRFSAGRLRACIGDTILPLAGIAEAPTSGLLRILRLTDGTAELAYGFAEVIDIRSVVLELQQAPAPGEIAGVALIDGAQVELLDPYWLFAAYVEDAPAEADRPVCALPSGDPWMENMLRPMIESLGYRVVDAASGVAADVVIASAEDESEPSIGAGEVLRIRANPEGAGGADDSIYRYDRAALLSALSRGAGRGRRNG